MAKALGWSPAKISRYELGQGGFPLDEVEKLLDFYEVGETRRAQLLGLAADANERGWWEDHADALSPEYMEFIGLEAEAASAAVWQVEAVPGLLQTQAYAREVHSAHQQVVLQPPGEFERRVGVRMLRKKVLTDRNPPLLLSAVLDESVLLRKVGSDAVMRDQLRHLAEISELPNVELRVLPLAAGISLKADSFVVFGFGSQHDAGALGDVVSTESVKSEIYIDGETDTYVFRLFFEAFAGASLPPDQSRDHIARTAQRFWS